jgi:hypothetical protein
MLPEVIRMLVRRGFQVRQNQWIPALPPTHSEILVSSESPNLRVIIWEMVLILIPLKGKGTVTRIKCPSHST